MRSWKDGEKKKQRISRNQIPSEMQTQLAMTECSKKIYMCLGLHMNFSLPHPFFTVNFCTHHGWWLTLQTSTSIEADQNSCIHLNVSQLNENCWCSKLRQCLSHYTKHGKAKHLGPHYWDSFPNWKDIGIPMCGCTLFTDVYYST